MKFKTLLLAFAISHSAIQLAAQISMGKMIGIDTRCSDPVERLQKFSHVREYHQWNDDVGDAASTTAACPEDFNAQGQSFMRYRYNQSLNGGALIFYDQFYERLYQKTTPVLMGLAPPMRGYNAYPAAAPHLLEQKPFCLDEAYAWNGGNSLPPKTALPPNHADPGAYRSHSLWMTLFSARYGATAYDNSAYAVDFLFPHYIIAPNQSYYDDFVEKYPWRSGLNYVRFIESWNEPEKSWRDDPADIAAGLGDTYYQMTAPQYAALVSADFDGHGKSAPFKISSIGSSDHWLGVRNVDPGMKMVLAGVADFRGKYVSDMVSWFKNNRVLGANGTPGPYGFVEGATLPFDVINFHHYSTQFSADDANALSGLSFRYGDIKTAPISGGGISPEDDHLKDEILYTIGNLEDDAPEVIGKEYWMTEFGYDSDGANSAVKVPAISGQDRQKTQGQWLVRSLLAINATQKIKYADLFELRDDPNLYFQNYGYSGLLTADFKPKRAWYYVHTLRNVLGKKYFDREIVPAPDDPEIIALTSSDAAAANTRIYKFINGSSITYAIWSPTSSGINYTCNLQFNPNQLPHTASIATIKDLDENGEWHIKAGTATHLIEHLPVSETPIFLALDFLKEDPLTLPVQNLTWETLCCDAVKVSWTNQGQYSKYYVYYALKSDLPNPVPFDYTHEKVKLFTDKLSGSATSVVIPKLSPAGTAYYIYIIPVGPAGNVPLTWEVQPSFVEVQAGGCGTGPCLINIPATSITYGNGSNPPPAQVISLLSADGIPNTCEDATGFVNNIWDDWDYTFNNPNTTAITIDLGQHYKLPLIYIFDKYGKGQLKIEYKNCFCNQFLPLVTLNLPASFDEWAHVANLADKLPIRYLKITKLDADAKIGRLLLCGAPVSCSIGAPDTDPPAAQDFTADDIQKNSARLAWSPIRYDVSEPSFGNMEEYLVRYSKNWSAQGMLINPLEMKITGGRWSEEPFANLIDLESGTTYKAELQPNMPCLALSEAPATTTFTTLDETEDRSKKGNASLSTLERAFLVYPNPSSGHVRVNMPGEGYSHLSVVRVSDGVQVWHFQRNPFQMEDELDSSLWMPGIYAVMISGEGKKTLVAKLCVQ